MSGKALLTVFTENHVAFFGKTSPALSEEGLTKMFKKGLVACACEWPVVDVQLSLSGLCSRENPIDYVRENLTGFV